MKRLGLFLLLGLLLIGALPIAFGANGQNADLNTTVTPEQKAQFDQILSPVMKIYNFVKYIATAVAAIFLLYAGISYMTSGGDPKKRDTAKNIAAYVIIGLLVIWAAPLLVNLLI
ncbi:MAG: pilin [Candidatus Woesearchaeota archaeon]|jgi:hypothetical protein